MDIYIYFKLDEKVDIDDLEEKIDEILGTNGEVTGRGMGISGGNMDIELYDEDRLDYFLNKIRELEFPASTYYVIDDIKKSI